MTALSIVLSLALLCHGALGWGETERNSILKMHNDYRRTTVTEKGACNMNKMEYDLDMEKDAEAYAKACRYEHKFEKYGENFAYNTNDHPENEMIKTAVNAWYGEIASYRYGQNACGESATCHYTQIVAANAKKMGCYAHRCDNLVGAGPHAWFFVCYYTPKGNWIGENAYPKQCDTPCKKGQTEENHLCVGEAEDENKFVCEDSTHYCKVWQQKGQCDRNPSYMNAKCPVACGQCVPEGGAAKAEETCIDNDPRCGMFAKRGECTRRAEHMKTRCPKSCKFC